MDFAVSAESKYNIAKRLTHIWILPKGLKKNVEHEGNSDI